MRKTSTTNNALLDTANKSIGEATNINDITSDLMNTKEAANYLGVALSTLTHYRKLDVGPAYIKMRFLVRYRKSDIDAWLNAQISSKK